MLWCASCLTPFLHWFIDQSLLIDNCYLKIYDAMCLTLGHGIVKLAAWIPSPMVFCFWKPPTSSAWAYAKRHVQNASPWIMFQEGLSLPVFWRRSHDLVASCGYPSVMKNYQTHPQNKWRFLAGIGIIMFFLFCSGTFHSIPHAPWVYWSHVAATSWAMRWSNGGSRKAKRRNDGQLDWADCCGPLLGKLPSGYVKIAFENGHL